MLASIKYKIMLIPVIGITVFSISVFYQAQTVNKNTILLSHIESELLPSLQYTSSMIKDFTNINETLTTAVTIGEKDLIDKSNKILIEVMSKIEKVHNYHESKELISTVKKLNEYHKISRKITEDLIDGASFSTEMEKRITGMNSLRDDVKNMIDINALEYKNAFKRAIDNAKKNADKSVSASYILTAIAAVILLFIGIFIAAIITKEINKISQSLSEFLSGDGDLTRRITKNSNDELGRLVENFNNFVQLLQKTISQIMVSINPLTFVSSDLNDLATKNSEHSTTQLQVADEVTHAIKEMIFAIEHIAENAAAASGSAAELDQTATGGKKRMQKTTHSLDSLKIVMTDTSQSIQELHDVSESVSFVIDVINNIAEQTNLLALNAAIEAARAGEMGRGFAVVADEVRNLASKTRDSTLQIRDLIEQLNMHSNAAVGEMDKAKLELEKTVEDMTHTDQSFEQIMLVIQAIKERNDQIASATEQQRAASQEITQNIKNMRGLTDSNGKFSSNIIELTEKLTETSNNLEKTGDLFNV